jgi:hypothetical protein
VNTVGPVARGRRCPKPAGQDHAAVRSSSRRQVVQKRYSSSIAPPTAASSCSPNALFPKLEAVTAERP